MLRAMFACTALVALGGCATTLEMTKVAKDDPSTAVGIPYDLPMTQFEVEVTRRVKDCNNALTGVTKAEIKGAAPAIDPGYMYAIDPSKLTNWMKTGELKAEYHPSGAIKSLNATVEDQTGPVIGNVVGGLAKVAVLVAAAGAPAKDAPPVNVCSADVRDALAAIPALKTAMVRDKGEVATWTEKLARLTAKATRLGANVDPKTRTELAAAIDALESASASLALSKQALQDQLDVISDVQSIRWPTDGDLFVSPKMGLRPAVLKAWAPSVSSIEIKQFDVYMTIERAGDFGRTPQNGRPQTVDLAGGLPVRRGAPGRLVVCSASPCTSDNVPIVLAATESPIAQLGTVYTVPYKNEAFQSSTLSAAFTEAGGLASVGVGQKASVAKEASAAFKDAATQAAALPGDLAAARTARIKAKTDEATARKALAEANASLSPATPGKKELLEDLKTDLDLAETEAKLIDAQATLEAARARRD